MLADHKKPSVYFFLGAGGVGKTTLSTSFALAAAMQGSDVALISIDPAKRLADVLGINLGSTLSKIQLGSEYKGSLEAMMLDQACVFADMVRRFSPSEESAQRIIDHPLYKACSDKMGGAIEYMALSMLADLYASQKFDCIILDTPPDSHALEFLAKPNILAGFVEEGVMRWLIKPVVFAQKLGLGKVLAFGEKLSGGLSKVAGSHALKLVAEFLYFLQDVLDGFSQAGEKVKKILADENTQMMLVTQASKAAVDHMEKMNAALNKMGFKIKNIYLNRCFLESICEEFLALSKDEINADTSLSLLGERIATENRVIEGLNRLKPDDPLIFKHSVLKIYDVGYQVEMKEGLRVLRDQMIPTIPN